MMRFAVLALLWTATSAYQPNNQKPSFVPTKQQVQSTAAGIAFSAMLAFGQPAFASPTAAQISLNSLPPSSISVEIGDLPVIGNLLSGTYTKISDGSVKSPSITIKSPKDKVAAVKELATAGHLEFDVSGLLGTHLDVDVAADEAGVAKVRVASQLIPKLPFKNLASASSSSPTGGKESPWNMVTNMGSGETYYYNEKSGVTQYERPDKF